MTKTFFIILISLLFSLALSHSEFGEPHNCNHDSLDFNPEFLDIDDGFSYAQGLHEDERLLQSLLYPKIRIYPHYDTITAVPAEYKNYFQYELIPPVLSLITSALRIKYPLRSRMRVTQSTVCGYATPEILTRGVNTDLFIFFSAEADTSSSWVASTSHCMLSSGINRPFIISIAVNTRALPIMPESNPLGHEYNIYTLQHEIFHGLGISKYLFNHFVDRWGSPLRNHVKNVTLSGTTRTVLDLAPLTSRLRRFYGCNALPGIYMENNGGSGTSGSHFERRFFQYDSMSSGGIHGRRLTQFSLAFLEGTGWYVPDYSYAEPFHYGQGQGCSFINQCTAPAVDDDTSEYCTGNGRGCTDIGRGGGFCKVETLSDGCRWYMPQREYGCMNPNGTYYTPFTSKQAYGIDANSRCFSGNLSTTGTVSQTTYCLKFNCVGRGSSTTLEVHWGTEKLICREKGKINVNGYSGGINCPDPLHFCNTIAPSYCPRSCSGRGRCVNNKCRCNRGYKGFDCAFRDI